MEFDNSKPIYLQIIHNIKKQLIRGELKIGDKIVSQRELAQQLQVNPNTIQRAYREMENMELVETVRGQGTFICNRPQLLIQLKTEMAESVLRHFINEMKSLGFTDQQMLECVKYWQEKIKEEEHND